MVEIKKETHIVISLEADEAILLRDFMGQISSENLREVFDGDLSEVQEQSLLNVSVKLHIGIDKIT